MTKLLQRCRSAGWMTLGSGLFLGIGLLMLLAGQVMPTRSSPPRARPVTILKAGHVFELGRTVLSGDVEDRVFPVPKAQLASDTTNPTVQIFVPRERPVEVITKPTIRLFGRSVEVFGRGHMMTGFNKRYMAIYLEITVAPIL